eukprot:1158580-Pelagomonas_calceolata.AAC.4
MIVREAGQAACAGAQAGGPSGACCSERWLSDPCWRCSCRSLHRGQCWPWYLLRPLAAVVVLVVQGVCSAAGVESLQPECGNWNVYAIRMRAAIFWSARQECTAHVSSSWRFGCMSANKHALCEPRAVALVVLLRIVAAEARAYGSGITCVLRHIRLLDAFRA